MDTLPELSLHDHLKREGTRSPADDNLKGRLGTWHYMQRTLEAISSTRSIRELLRDRVIKITFTFHDCVLGVLSL